MSAILSPYGLRPINLIGGQPFNGGVIREFDLVVNTASAFAVGDVIQLSATGVPSPIAASPTAINVAGAANATAGIVGVCVGVSYVDPTLKYQMFGQYLPPNAVTAGYTNVKIRVCDDPDQLYLIQGSAAFGTLTNGPAGAVGKNAALGNFGRSAMTGLSTINLVVGVNGASLAATTTLAMRIVDVPQEGALDAFPDLIVKFNVGVHSYTNPLGV
jgi:hypothetical protein